LAVASAAVVAANLAGVAAFLGEALASLPRGTAAGGSLRAALGVLGVGYAAFLIYLAALAPGVVRDGHGHGHGRRRGGLEAPLLAAEEAAGALPLASAGGALVVAEEEEEEEEAVVMGGRAQALALAAEAAAADAQDGGGGRGGGGNHNHNHGGV
jgi:hypothetical protein